MWQQSITDFGDYTAVSISKRLSSRFHALSHCIMYPFVIPRSVVYESAATHSTSLHSPWWCSCLPGIAYIDRNYRISRATLLCHTRRKNDQMETDCDGPITLLRIPGPSRAACCGGYQ
jgi:hypothetical protein